METNLPELCRRVWGRVPAVIPYDTEDHLSVVVPKRPDEDPVWYIPGRTHAISDDMAESMICDSCHIWLLDRGCATSSGPNYTYRVYPTSGRDSWEVCHSDLTTCLLLAVERCHEYKESKE